MKTRKSLYENCDINNADNVNSNIFRYQQGLSKEKKEMKQLPSFKLNLFYLKNWALLLSPLTKEFDRYKTRMNDSYF